ncbi:hypothetical protein MPRS_14530 [Mycobacterium paraseoulense]|nr:hypothetical protein MPRS_14530 [Mycobacterium paraseoulense]
MGANNRRGERLPSKAELSQLFGVGTYHVSQHLIETTRGVRGGSFISDPDPAHAIALGAAAARWPPSATDFSAAAVDEGARAAGDAINPSGLCAAH